jgi:hypothetical protein
MSVAKAGDPACLTRRQRGPASCGPLWRNAPAGYLHTFRTYVRSMNDSRVMTEGQKLGEMGNAKRTIIILVAVLVSPG